MTVQYGPTIENLNIAIEKASEKNDGVYSFRGFAYKVVSGKLTHLAHNNQVLERAGNFNVLIGECGGIGSFYDRKALHSIK